ncbi:hypothetical protein SDC9_138267 [bioreactor metagenome]|uniref:DUF1648 domain-containing protein n=1 Tax=bioreactor metagenome TaxID=1076179 RepID=A0A645DPC9_9ZZZZ
MLIGVVVYLAVNWRDIPDRIPGHYNAMGVVDRWGSKSGLIALPVIAIIMYISLTVVGHFPQIWNTGVTVTQENKERVYRILKNMLQTMKLLIVSVFSFLTVNSISGRNLSAWFLPIFLILLFGSMAYFIRKLFKSK